MKKGDIITFGKYDWIILDIQNNGMLIMTKEIIKQMKYHNKHEEVTWETSSLRKYLNTDFLTEFNNFEQEKIISIINKNNGNNWYHPGFENDTKDKIFILSLEEMVGKYFNDSTELLNNKGENQRYWFERKDVNNVLRKSSYLGYSWWYWVRTGGRLKTSAVYIHGNGNIGIQGNKASKKSYNTLHPVTQSNEGGIRPALWLNLDK